MSSAAAHAPHDNEAHAFDGEPVDTLPDDEPPTPAWLPVLGLVFFVGLAVALVAGGGSDAPAAIAAPPPVAAQAQLAVPVRPAAPQPTAQATGAHRPARLTPDQVEKLKEMNKRIEEQKAKGLLPPGHGAPPAH